MKKSSITYCLFLLLAVAAITPSSMAVETSDSPASFQAQRKPGRTDRVIIHLKVGGETKYTDAGKTRGEKMSVACNLEYFEKTLEMPTAADGVARSVRDYQNVSAAVKVGDGQFTPALQPQHRLIAVEAGRQSTLLFCPHGNLTRDELDAIEVQANSLLLDGLLPDAPVAVGDQWPHSAELMAAMLGLDEASKSTVESTLKEVTDMVARFEFAGRVDGTIYGASTTIEIMGKYRFDLRTRRIDWLGMLAKEVRGGSFVADGVDVVSRLEMAIVPAREPASLADAALARLTLKATPQLTRLTYESGDGNWQCQHDRRWYLHYDRPKNSVVKLRLVDGGAPVGQCIASSLPQQDPAALVSLDEFQGDVRRALGKDFGEFVEASQASNAANYRIYRVVAHGTSADVAMRWIYYLVADSQGRRAALTFAVEQELVERFAEADKPMVESLRFVDTKKKRKEHHGDTEDTETTKEDRSGG
jgi:hypothetical protein